MNLLDAIEKAIGIEYLGEAEQPEITALLQKVHNDITLSVQTEQPNANRVVNIYSN